MAGSIQQAVLDELARKSAKATPQVAKQVSLLTVRVPVIRRVETTAVKQEVVDKAVEQVRDYLAVIGDHMGDLVARMEKIHAASREERAVRSGELKELETEVLAHLYGEEEMLRTAARGAYARALLANAKPSKWSVMGILGGRKFSDLPGLVKLEMVSEVISGEPGRNKVSAKIYGVTYVFNGRRDEANALAESLEDLATRASTAARKHWDETVEKIEEQATEENALLLRESVAGRFYLEVPDDRSGEKVLPGGVLLVESDSKNVKVLQAAGHFQRIMEEIRDAGTFVSVESLSEERLPYIKDKDLFRRIRILHAVLRRGLEEAEKEAAREKRVAEFKAKADAEREALATKATVSPLEWLSTDTTGTTMIYLGRKLWTITDRTSGKDTPYFEVYFLLERDADGKVRIVEYPERLKPLFEERFSELTEVGERFEGLKYPLGSMLRTAYAYEEARANEAAEEARKLALKEFVEGQTPPAAGEKTGSPAEPSESEA